MNLPDFLTRDPDGFVHFAGRRIGLHHVVRLYNEGYSPEGILEQYPVLSLLLIHKAIVFYLENRADVDRLIAGIDAEIERQMAQPRRGPNLAELRRRTKAVARSGVT